MRKPTLMTAVLVVASAVAGCTPGPVAGDTTPAATTTTTGTVADPTPAPPSTLPPATVTALPEPPRFRHVVVDAAGPLDPHVKAVGDVDGDGVADLVVGSSAGGPLVWYRSPGWERGVIAPAGAWSTDGALGDVDGDGDLDLVISEWNLNRVEWYENDSGSWVRHVVGSPRAHDLEAADLDLDGDLDLVSRDQGPEGVRLVVWRHDGDDVWAGRVVEGLAAGEGLTVGDLDRDGLPDVVVPGGWLAPPSDLVAGEWVSHVVAPGAYPESVVAVADLDGDGRPDLVATPSEGEDATRWYRAPADPVAGTWEERLIEDPVEYTHSLVVADFNRDGAPDVVAAEMHQSAGTDEIRLYLNRNGATDWDRSVIDTTGSHDLQASDLDGDGDVDLFGANWTGPYQPVEVWLNLSVP